MITALLRGVFFAEVLASKIDLVTSSLPVFLWRAIRDVIQPQTDVRIKYRYTREV